MTTLETWIDFSLKVLEDNVGILRECQAKGEIDLLIEQSKALKKHVDSFLDFLERKKKFSLMEDIKHEKIGDIAI